MALVQLKSNRTMPNGHFLMSRVWLLSGEIIKNDIAPDLSSLVTEAKFED